MTARSYPSARPCICRCPVQLPGRERTCPVTGIPPHSCRPAVLSARRPFRTGTRPPCSMARASTPRGIPREYEYALRMYSYTNTESPPRPNRVSAYVFNLDGGMGSGAYFQDTNVIGNWMMVTLVVDAQATSGWSHGYVALYKNGVLRGKVSLSQYDVKPGAAGAPFRIATRSLDSYFEGAIGKVAVYDSALPQSDIAATYKAMLSPGS